MTSVVKNKQAVDISVSLVSFRLTQVLDISNVKLFLIAQF